MAHRNSKKWHWHFYWVLALGVFALVAVFAFYAFKQRRLVENTPVVGTVGVSSSRPPASQRLSDFLRSQKGVARASPAYSSATFARSTLNPAEAALLKERKGRLIKSFQSLEQARAKLLRSAEWEEGNVAIVVVAEPSVEELSAMYDEIQSHLADMPGDSILFRKAYEEFRKLLFDFADYPQRIKVLAVTTATEEYKRANRGGWFNDTWFAEYFVSDESEAVRERSDKYGFAIPLEKARTDADLEARDSWAGSRYGYLFKFENTTK